MRRARIIFATLVLSGAMLLPPRRPALAKGDNAGTLGSGGRVKGDISRDAGETDRVGVDLDEGAAVTILFRSSFVASVVLTGPGGAAVDLGGQAGHRLEVRHRPVEASGRYEFAITSGDGSQGVYSLVVKQRWAKTLATSGTGPGVIDVGMPTAGKLGCVVRGVAGRPRILGLEDPSGHELLQAPVVAGGHVATLRPTPTTAAGVYHLSVDATDGASDWTATVRRFAPTVPGTTLDLTNGLDAVSFSGDGVGRVFASACGRCHGWATSYPGVRGYVSRAMVRIVGGSMPPGGRLPNSQIALIRAWIKTGRAR